MSHRDSDLRNFSRRPAECIAWWEAIYLIWRLDCLMYLKSCSAKMHVIVEAVHQFLFPGFLPTHRAERSLDVFYRTLLIKLPIRWRHISINSCYANCDMHVSFLFVDNATSRVFFSADQYRKVATLFKMSWSILIGFSLTFDVRRHSDARCCFLLQTDAVFHWLQYKRYNGDSVFHPMEN